jgi:hypothetical protein
MLYRGKKSLSIKQEVIVAKTKIGETRREGFYCYAMRVMVSRQEAEEKRC